MSHGEASRAPSTKRGVPTVRRTKTRRLSVVEIVPSKSNAATMEASRMSDQPALSGETDEGEDGGGEDGGSACAGCADDGAARESAKATRCGQRARAC